MLGMVLLAMAACGRCGAEKKTDVADAPSNVTDAPAPPSTDASIDARVADANAPDAALTPEQRKAFGAAVTEGRKRTTEKKYDKAIEAFTQALAIAPDEPRALAERGYAKYLKGDLEGAMADLNHASATANPKDDKLASQIEYNLGLVSDAMADTGWNDQMRGVAVGHYRRANELSPSKAAASKMGGCPASWGPVEIKTYASIKDATAKLGGSETDWTALADEGVVRRERVEPMGTELLVPIDGARFAYVLVGSTAMWNCGTLGTVSAVKRADVWKVEYQAHRGAAQEGLCTCGDDDTPCERADCKCPDPFCRMVCGNADQEEGDHQEVYLDAKTGAGIWRLLVAHGYMAQLSLDVDLAAHRFRATGLGCIADLPLGGK